MGTVYLAEQTAPVRRLVPLKLIEIGMDSREVLVRFDAERQALAQQHAQPRHVCGLKPASVASKQATQHQFK